MSTKLERIPDACVVPTIKHTGNLSNPVPWEEVDKIIQQIPAGALIDTLKDKPYEERAATYRMGKFTSEPDEYGMQQWSRLRIRIEVSPSNSVLMEPEKRLKPLCNNPIEYWDLPKDGMYVCQTCKMVHHQREIATVAKPSYTEEDHALKIRQQQQNGD